MAQARMKYNWEEFGQSVLSVLKDGRASNMVEKITNKTWHESNWRFQFADVKKGLCSSFICSKHGLDPLVTCQHIWWLVYIHFQKTSMLLNAVLLRFKIKVLS